MLTLPKETLELIQKTAQDAVAVKVQPLPNDPEQTLIIAAGSHEIIPTPLVPKHRRHVVTTVGDFAAAYARWSADGKETEPLAGETAELRLPCIWVDLARSRLLFYTDEPLRRAWVRLDLLFSPQWQKAVELAKGIKIKHAGLVRLLRHDLAGCTGPEVLGAFRSLDFTKILNARAIAKSNQQSLDTDLQARVQTGAGGEIPEEFSIEVPVFAMRDLAGSRARFTVTVDANCETQEFTLQILPGQVELAVDDARAEVIGRLSAALHAVGAGPADENGVIRATGVCILAGSPSTKQTDGDE